MRIIKNEPYLHKLIRKLRNFRWKLWYRLIGHKRVINPKFDIHIEKGVTPYDTNKTIPTPFPRVDFSSIYNMSYDVLDKKDSE